MSEFHDAITKGKWHNLVLTYNSQYNEKNLIGKVRRLNSTVEIMSVGTEICTRSFPRRN